MSRLMIGILFLLLLAVPIAELYVIVRVADHLGVLQTLALLIAISILGTVLLKREGLATWRRLNTQLRTGKVPATEVVDGALIMLGGALLLTPGFITDAAGLVLLIPPTRAVVKAGARKAMAGWVVKKHPVGHAGFRVYEATAEKRRSDPEGVTPRPPSSLPEGSGPRGDAGGDSPGRG